MTGTGIGEAQEEFGADEGSGTGKSAEQRRAGRSDGVGEDAEIPRRAEQVRAEGKGELLGEAGEVVSII